MLITLVLLGRRNKGILKYEVGNQYWLQLQAIAIIFGHAHGHLPAGILLARLFQAYYILTVQIYVRIQHAKFRAGTNAGRTKV